MPTVQEEGHTMPTIQRRPVRYKYTPIMSTLFGSRSIAHQAIGVGDPRTQTGVTTFELLKVRNTVEYHVTKAPFATVDVKNQVIGYTIMSDADIEQYGKRMPALL